MNRLGLTPWRAALAVIAAVVCMGVAPDPADRLHDPGQEARARHLFAQFRCLVCQNESIDDSEADLASDLRQIVRQQVAAGRTDPQIRAFMVDRYGEFVLLKPRFSPGNAVLWLAPAVIVLAGGAIFALKGRRRVSFEPALTAEEELQLSALIGSESSDMVPPNIGPTSSPGMTET